MRPNFQVNRVDFDLIQDIAKRACAIEHRVFGRGDMLRWLMDLSAAHTSVPLRLQELLEADDSNFAHDAFGIRRHLNRDTGQLEGCFTPRYAKG